MDRRPVSDTRRTRDPPQPSSKPSAPAGDLSASANATGIAPLLALYCAWKALLLLVAAASPGLGYDTSTDILLAPHASSSPPDSSSSGLSHVASHLARRLTRWDAIYFAFASERAGLVYEQQWAFSPTLTDFTSRLASVFPSSFCTSRISCHALTGSALSHLTHLLAVILLYQLTYDIVPLGNDKKSRVAFTAACLHILSPASLFLSAFYGEAPFALANSAGMYMYVLAQRHHHRPLAHALVTTMSGIAFGCSAMIRSNGLLSGMILAWDALTYLPKLPSLLRRMARPELTRLSGLLLGGVCCGVGYLLPQGYAYVQYCTGDNTRPWCDRRLPSIYTWVQEHYWGVGFLRYWTLSNLPLFLLATPMILVLVGTAWISLSAVRLLPMLEALEDSDKGSSRDTVDTSLFVHVMGRFALPQLVLALLATTSFHVQIINRISSGYPVWYILIALAIHGARQDAAQRTVESISRVLQKSAQWIVRGAVMYALVQGGLYASFLPPA